MNPCIQLIDYEPRCATFQEEARRPQRIKHFDESCSICLAKYLATDRVKVLACEHFFHTSCLGDSKACHFDNIPIGAKKITLFQNRHLIISDRAIRELEPHKSDLVDFLSELAVLLPAATGRRVNNLLAKLRRNENIYDVFVRSPGEMEVVVHELLNMRNEYYGGHPIFNRELDVLFMCLQDLCDILDGSVEGIDVEPRVERIWQKYHHTLTTLVGPAFCMLQEPSYFLADFRRLFSKHFKVQFYYTHIFKRINNSPLYPMIKNQTYNILYVRQFKSYRRKSKCERYKMVWDLAFFKSWNLYQRCGEGSKTGKDIKSKITQVWGIKAILGLVTGLFCCRRLR